MAHLDETRNSGLPSMPIKAVIVAFVLPDEFREGPAVLNDTAADFINLLIGSFFEPTLQGFNLLVG
jgi:hypothetical protein